MTAAGRPAPVAGGLAPKGKACAGDGAIAPRKAAPWCSTRAILILAALVHFVVISIAWALPKFDVMNGLSNDSVLGPWALQAIVTGFCFTPSGDYAQNENFLQTGEIDESEYAKGSVYALLYGLYRSAGKVRHLNGDLYEFSFNTWGIHNVDDLPYGPEEPQRHGKAAYNKLASSFGTVREYIRSKPSNSVSFLEIGCGTGAGANLISSEVWPDLKVYNALDMQAAAINKCKSWGNPKLNCVHGNGQRLPFENRSIDVVVINEAHIAEKEIGAEERAIFAEMIRILKPGGFFLWGNALPTRVWDASGEYLSKIGFEQCGSFNHTKSAVIARDEDHERVKLYLEQLYSRFWVFRAPIVGSRCKAVSDALMRNFFRDVGTDLYQRMVTGYDSYMHQCHQIVGN